MPPQRWRTPFRPPPHVTGASRLFNGKTDAGLLARSLIFDDASSDPVLTFTLLDNFNRASLGSNWSTPWYSTDAPLTITSNQLAGTGAAYSDGWWNSGDQPLETGAGVTVATLGSGGYLFIRGQNEGTTTVSDYEINWDGSGNLSLWIAASGSYTQLSNVGGQTITAGNKIGLIAFGTNPSVVIKIYRDTGTGWTEIHSFTDSNGNRITLAGVIGLGFSNNVGRADDFGTLAFVAPSGQNFIRRLNETSNLAEGRNRNLGLRRLWAETANLVEGRLRVSGFVRALAETLNISELSTRRSVLLRRLAESIQATEATRNPRGLRRLSAETVQASEQRISARTLRRLIAESLQSAETRSRSLGLRRFRAEGAQLSETRFSAKGFIRGVAESLNISEVRQTAKGFLRVVGETINLTEARLRAVRFVRRLSESVQLQETRLSRATYKRLLNETANLSEVNRASRILRRLRLEVANLSESVSRVRVLRQLVTEILNITELSRRLLNLRKFVAESLAITEARLRRIGFVRVRAETVSGLEVAGRSRGLRRLANEVLRSVEQSSASRVLKRVRTEIAQLSEARLVWSSGLVVLGTLILSLFKPASITLTFETSSGIELKLEKPYQIVLSIEKLG